MRKDSELDFMNGDCEPNESRVSTRQACLEDDEMSSSDSTKLTLNSSEASQRTMSELDLQPEDQDEELEMSLNNQGSSLVQLYPSMIAQIERAWQRQHVYEAGDSVLRRYRKWRRTPSRINLNITFEVTQRGAKNKPKKKSSETILEETFHSPPKRQFPGTSNRAPETSPLRKVTSPQERYTLLQSPGRDRGTPRRKTPQPVLVMDFSCASETSESERSLLKNTFNVAQLSPPSYSQSSSYTVSPRPHCPSASSDPSLRFKRLPLSAHSAQNAGCSRYETICVKEGSDIYGSPVRQSPLKARMMMTSEGLGRSPPTHAFSRSPKSDSVSYSREPMRSRSMAMFLSSPSKKTNMPLWMIHPQESHHSFQSQQHSPPTHAFSRSPKSDSVSYSREHARSRSIAMCLTSPLKKPGMPRSMIHPQESHHSFKSQQHSPLSVTAAGRHKVRRHLSLGSTLPQSPISYSQKELDDDFAKVYHKFVCLNKSSLFRGASCRLCTRSSETSRGHSSSALAALALSPHRSVLRKRHRELDWDSHPQSKRFREMHCTYSPGSKRHGKEMLTQFTQQPSAEARQFAWIPLRLRRRAAEFSGLGGSLESKWQLATSEENGGEHNRKYINYGKAFSKRSLNKYWCGK
ncbi:uncharacterized protein si:dkeyp-117h8.4 [Scomber japonicus]|uniref:uncharacterized protein si:dkeyp-117h8.4 n=1 Tax=Scomber japonicus TaxID=13676 RepID=UPI002305C184|nr:uncharacterized protein si:dkeyp-117h8.4 [Scomber japonicus]